MDYSSARAYINAKTSALLKKAFIGKRSRILYNAQTLSEMWNILFASDAPSVSNANLAQKIEEEAESRFVSQYGLLLDCYDNAPEVLKELLQFYVLENIKTIASSLATGEKKLPHLVHCKGYDTLHYDAWPNLQAITKGTEFSWLTYVPTIENQNALDAKLDRLYVEHIWQSIQNAPRALRNELARFFCAQYSMLNIVWTLRLKVYYKMSANEIKSHLIYANENKNADELSREAFSILEKDIHNWDDWRTWKFAKFLNEPRGEKLWTLDPRTIENATKILETKKAYALFHKFPLSDLKLVAFFKMKQHECNIIRTIAEAKNLQLSFEEVQTIAGIDMSR